ncbi:MAG: glutathione S-transferase [Pseudomonadota bacterium]
MTYTLYLGDRSYSSWSLRAWLLREVWELPIDTIYVDFSAQDVAAQLADAAPARTVPTLKTPEGAIISESLAIAEELATRFSDAPLWPRDPLARATARSLASEMHAGFGPLREECPMNLRAAYSGVVPSENVQADLRRLETIWASAMEATGGPWLCGDYSIADAFYAPVAARIAGYGLSVSEVADEYVSRHLSHLPFRRWRAMGLVKGEALPWYRRDYPSTDWPGPTPLAANAVTNGPSVNDACPYSGDPVTDFLDFNGQTYGFCNPFCRDKTVADPEAWPKFMAIVR